MTRIIRLCPVVFLAALLAACGSLPGRKLPQQQTPPSSKQTADANAVLFRAIALVGTPYHYGGNTPAGGFDCSGLVGYVFHDAAGVELPRTAAEMSALPARKLGSGALRSGDLVFFRTGRWRIGHVGIYVGQHRFVHAPNSGGTVRLDSLDASWWHQHFAYGKRVL